MTYSMFGMGAETSNQLPPPAGAGSDEALRWAIDSSHRVLRLTDAWTPFDVKVPAQASFAWHPARFKVNPSGRRSGKTAIVKRKAVMRLLRKRGRWPAQVFLAAPTLDQARTIFWDEIKALVPTWWVAKINESRMLITTKWGAILKVVGMDRPQRIEGTPWDYCAIDEIADCRARCFSLNVRPALSTRGREGECDLTGVPDEVGRNQAEYEELYHRGMQWPLDPDLCTFHWSSADVLDAKEIEAARRSMDPLSFEQEYMGKFVSSGGKALPRFDVRYHTNHDDFCQYTAALPTDWTMDFGVGTKSASLLCQGYKGHVWVMDEISLLDGSTEAQAEALPARLGKLGISSANRLRIFGDAAGHGRNTAIGRSDYDVLGQKLTSLRIKPEWWELTAPPLVKDTLNAVRGRVATADNVVHLHIHSRCERLIEDCRKAPWPDRLQLRDFHYLAALRYYCFQEYGVGGPRGYSVAPNTNPNLQAGRAPAPLPMRF